MRCSKNKKEWTDAQARVEDLKQQLEEAEGLVVRKKDQFDKSRKQVRLSIRVSSSQSFGIKLEEKILNPTFSFFHLLTVVIINRAKPEIFSRYV